MLLSRTTRQAVGFGLCACGFLFAASASALPQFTPTATQFLHTPLSGPQGVEWNTGGGGTQLSYDSGTEILTITGFVDVLNYYDTAGGSGCETDSGSNCALNYSPDLDFVLTASFVDVDPVQELIPGVVYKLTFNFETVGVGDSDLTVTDPSDGDSPQLTANVAAGFYNGDPTDGLIASVIYNVLTGETTTNVIDGAGVLDVTGGPHSSLFGSGPGPLFGLSLAAIDSFDDGAGGGLSEIVTVAYNTGSLPDFTAEASGQLYRIENGNFVIPEPGTALLAGLGLAILGLARRRTRD